MKKIIFLSVVVLLAGSFLASCSDQKDCTCTYSATKSAQQKATSGSATQPVYDWGGSCSSIQASDLDLSGNYNVSCTEM